MNVKQPTNGLLSFPTGRRRRGGSRLTLTFGGVVFNGLFKGRDVTEGAQEEDHLLLLISNGGNLHKKPHGRP